MSFAHLQPPPAEKLLVFWRSGQAYSAPSCTTRQKREQTPPPIQTKKHRISAGGISGPSQELAHVRIFFVCECISWDLKAFWGLFAMDAIVGSRKGIHLVDLDKDFFGFHGWPHLGRWIQREFCLIEKKLELGRVDKSWYMVIFVDVVQANRFSYKHSTRVTREICVYIFI